MLLILVEIRRRKDRLGNGSCAPAKAGAKGTRARGGHCVAMIIQEKGVFRVSEDVKNERMDFWGRFLV